MKSGDSGGILFDWQKEVLEKALVKEAIEEGCADCTALLESAVGNDGGMVAR